MEPDESERTCAKCACQFLQGTVPSLAERIAFERITSRKEAAAAEARHAAERDAWERERTVASQRTSALERLLGSAVENRVSEWLYGDPDTEKIEELLA